MTHDNTIKIETEKIRDHYTERLIFWLNSYLTDPESELVKEIIRAHIEDAINDSHKHKPLLKH